MPAADQVIFPTTCVGKEFLAFANRQFINEVIHPDVVTIIVVRAVSDFGINRVIVAIEVVGMGEGVVRQQLEAMTEALFYLHLEGIVVVAGVIAEVVAHVF